MSKFDNQFKAARRAGTPLIAIQTPDPAAALATIKRLAKSAPIIVWDCVNGWNDSEALLTTNEKGLAAIRAILPGVDVAAATRIPVEMLDSALALPEDSILVMYGAQRLFDQNDSAGVAQAIQGLWNLRDRYKSSNRTAVLMSPTFTLPGELSQDIFVLDEPLPNTEELRAIVQNMYASAELEPVPETVEKALDALRGLAAFSAEQVTAMSLTAAGLNVDELWERKRQMIEATPGLNVWQGGEKFDDVGGCDQVKLFLRKVLAGRRPPKVIVWLDEIEKALGGSGDTTGISQDYLGTVLSFMQDNEASGVIFLGVPGAAKSALAKATGAEADVPTIRLDLNGMKGSLVGESEKRLREALKIVKAVGDGGIFFVATCNKIEALPPELRRRFKLGLFYFDLPTASERRAIWQMYSDKFKFTYEQSLDVALSLFDHTDWTGAEIRTCCELAADLDITLAEASAFIVPVAKASPESVNTLRRQASGKYLSASYPGVFNYESSPTAAQPMAAPSGRRINTEE